MDHLVEMVTDTVALDSLDFCEIGRTSLPCKANHSPEPSMDFCKNRKNILASCDVHTNQACRETCNHHEELEADWQIYEMIKDSPITIEIQLLIKLE